MTHRLAQGKNNSRNTVQAGSSYLLNRLSFTCASRNGAQTAQLLEFRPTPARICTLTDGPRHWRCSPEGSLWCSGLCWSKDDTGSWAVAFCWVCVSRGTGRGLRNSPPGSSGHPRYWWATRRARSSCRNYCLRSAGGGKNTINQRQ